jgi:hypothetical protein
MADGIRVCGKPDWHTGRHYSRETVQREEDRMVIRRTTPGPCTMAGCTQPRVQFCTGSFDVRCCIHITLHECGRQLRKAEAAWAEMVGKPFTREEIDEAVRRADSEYPAARQIAFSFTIKSILQVP